MGFYAPAQLVRDARDHGIEIKPADINRSDWDCTLVKGRFDPAGIAARHVEMRSVIKSMRAVQLGFNQVRGLSRERMEEFVSRRGAGYASVRDVWLRSGLDVKAIECLANADAFHSIGLDRRAALWAVRALDGKSAAERLPLFDRSGIQLRDLEPETKLPVMPPGEHVLHDYRALGLSLKAHPLAFLRRRLTQAGITPNIRLAAIENGRRVSVAGLVLVRQRPGKGNAIFLTLEDEAAIANIVVWQRDFARLLPTIMGSKFIRVTGKLQSAPDVIHVVAEKMEDLSPWLAVLRQPATASAAESRNRQATMPGCDSSDPELMAQKAREVMPKGRNFQ
jgi:error-prone DNA polymerase